MASLIEADAAASAALWQSGFYGLLRQSFDPEAPVLIPGAHLHRAGELLLTDGGADEARPIGRMHWSALGVRLSTDSLIGATWGAVVNLRDSLLPSPGRYAAVWRHQADGWRIVAFSLLGVAPSGTIEWGRRPRTTTFAAADHGAERYLHADREFARLAADSGASRAFTAWAAPDALLFGSRGFLIQGAGMIGAAVDGPAAWDWWPVDGGGTDGGSIGWTVGEATITPTGGPPLQTKYLSVWEAGRNGTIRFIVDAGSARP
jgi:hypothetical protein